MRPRRRELAAVAAAALAVVLGAALRTPAQSHAAKRATPGEAVQTQQKKNAERPEEKGGDGDKSSPTTSGGAKSAHEEDPNAARYTYEFSQPDFVVHFTHIEHDDAGHGLIRFERRSDSEQITEPLELSAAAMARIRAHYAALNFLDSTENYQGQRFYPSQGKNKLTLRRGGRERTAEFNYSQNTDAEGLADEYRRAGEQAVAVFDIGVALESQPLELPKLIEGLGSLIERNYVSDKQQLAPLLRDLSEDERVPLIGRNQAARILKKLGKQGS